MSPSSKPRKCTTLECDEVLSPNSELDTCKLCRGADYYWNRIVKKDPGAIIRRRRNLIKYGDRLDNMMDKKKIVILRRKRRNA